MNFLIIESKNMDRYHYMTDRFEDWKPPKMEHGKFTVYNWIPYHPDKIKLGYKCDIGALTCLFAHEGIEIGENAQIGGGVRIYSLSTIDNKRGKVVIKNNAKIGANSVIMPNVIIGENAIVGALSYVKEKTKIKKNEVWVGCPAKKIR